MINPMNSILPILAVRQGKKRNKRYIKTEEENGKKKRKDPPSNAMVYEVAREYSDSLNEPSCTTTRSDDEAHAKCNWVRVIAITLLGFLVFAFGLLLEGWPSPGFALAVSSIEGLSPSSQPPAAISPVFTLALHVNNGHPFYRACFVRGETRVFYHAVQIAAAPIEGFCVDSLSEKDVTVRAWSFELQLPVFLRDQLYEDKMKRKGAFDVQLRLDQKIPGSMGRYSYDRLAINCHTAVGDAGMTWCQVCIASRPYTSTDHCFIAMRAMTVPCGAAAAAPTVGIAGNEQEIVERGVKITGETKAM